jgi:hypothetical protein
MTDSTAITVKPELVEELLKLIREPKDLFGPVLHSSSPISPSRMRSSKQDTRACSSLRTPT